MFFKGTSSGGPTSPVEPNDGTNNYSSTWGPTMGKGRLANNFPQAHYFGPMGRARLYGNRFLYTWHTVKAFHARRWARANKHDLKLKLLRYYASHQNISQGSVHYPVVQPVTQGFPFFFLYLEGHC
eukprot:4357852-Amphidinium_carterae.2